jgi:hypothetical protein
MSGREHCGGRLFEPKRRLSTNWKITWIKSVSKLSGKKDEDSAHLEGRVAGPEEGGGRGRGRGELEEWLPLPHAAPHGPEVAQLPLHPEHGVQVPLRRHDHKVL